MNEGRVGSGQLGSARVGLKVVCGRAEALSGCGTFDGAMAAPDSTLETISPSPRSFPEMRSRVAHRARERGRSSMAASMDMVRVDRSERMVDNEESMTEPSSRAGRGHGRARKALTIRELSSRAILNTGVGAMPTVASPRLGWLTVGH
jgi:hypothetical protein